MPAIVARPLLSVFAVLPPADTSAPETASPISVTAIDTTFVFVFRVTESERGARTRWCHHASAEPVL